jgi:hypothetical protein
MAGAYAASFETDIGGCSATTCVVPVSIAFGTFAGFLIGNEMDKLYNLRYSHAPPLSLHGTQLPLVVVPNDLLVSDHTVYVTGAEGVQVVDAGPRLEPEALKARGLRGIGPVAAVRPGSALLVGTSVGLYRFPLAVDEPGTLAYPGEVSALSADSTLLAIGLGPDVQLARVGDSLEALGEPVAEEARVVDLAWQGRTRLWVLTEDRLAGYDVGPDGTTSRLGAHDFPAIARRLALEDTLALVAAGSGGVFAIDLRDPGAPAELANWSGARFVYDVAALGDTVYVAAGPEGLYILRFGPEGFTPLGLSREMGFVPAVEAKGNAIYVLDRTTGTLRRIPFGPEQ